MFLICFINIILVKIIVIVLVKILRIIFKIKCDFNLLFEIVIFFVVEVNILDFDEKYNFWFIYLNVYLFIFVFYI